MAPVCTSGSGEMPNMLKVHSYTLGNSSIHVYHRNISALVTRESSVHRLNS